METLCGDYRSPTLFCGDVVREHDGRLREVLASSSWPPSADLYERTRPLLALATCLLALALASLLAQEALRRSVHGWAMGAHATALLVVDVLQLAVFLHGEWTGCEYVAYIVYFFMMSAGSWLNIVSVNMTLGFWRLPGHQKTRGGGGSVGAWKRFSFHCVYAWGFPAALTGVCVYMYSHRGILRSQGYMTPSLFETKTCFYEVIHVPKQQTYSYDHVTEMGALLYYYAPMGVLVLVNFICVVLTVVRIRFLRRDTQILRKSKRGNQNTMNCWDSPKLQSALVYTKLLLTAGVAELALEAVAWGVRRRRHRSGGGALEVASETALVFRTCSTFLEVLRAAAVCWLCRGPWRAWVTRAWHWVRRRSPSREGNGLEKKGSGNTGTDMGTTRCDLVTSDPAGSAQPRNDIPQRNWRRLREMWEMGRLNTRMECDRIKNGDTNSEVVSSNIQIESPEIIAHQGEMTFVLRSLYRVSELIAMIFENDGVVNVGSHGNKRSVTWESKSGVESEIPGTEFAEDVR